MSIVNLYLKNFRNLSEQKITFNSSLNFIVGDNGSGKSSILESIFFLGHGKSFRTNKAETVCHFEQDDFFINIRDEQQHSYGLSKNKKDLGFAIRKNSKRISRLSDLASEFAIQIVTPESFKLFFGGAKERRKFLDLGLFHVEHQFKEKWQTFTKIHKQRNAVIRNRLSKEHYDYWTKEFVYNSIELTELRKSYCKRLEEELRFWLTTLLPEVVDDLVINFYQGWSSAKPLNDVLSSQKEREYQIGYSQSGAHKFDLKFLINNKPIELKLSRGQQKLFLVALTFAQMKMIEKVKQVKAILLVDDIGAELDLSSRTKFNEALNNLSCQIMITAIDAEALSPLISTFNKNEDYTMFHVEHGKVSEIKK
ncbi:DNA replication/repair protein RecF [Colwellia sp. MEBiC06753]